MRTFDRQACAARNRLAARRDGVNTADFRTLPSEEFAAGLRMPNSTSACLERINALLPTGTEPLEADQVYVHFLEAANDGFIPDRYLFLGNCTLRNIAKKATTGIAFMNSHRTGGLSHPSELPFGKTFAGAIEDRDGRTRAVVGVYMLRGQHPNGEGGPSTDDLDAMIRGGVLTDVSVGLRGGSVICDVCGEDLDSYDACLHIPGTNASMTAAQLKAQKERGVPTGYASASLLGADLAEISSVYDGAVPGAGFRKALALRRDLEPEHRLQAAAAYRNLARGDFDEVERGPVPSFEEQLEAALAAAEGCVTRAEGYRNLSGGRLAELETLHERLSTVRERLARPERRRDLTRRALSLRAAQVAGQAGEHQ